MNGRARVALNADVGERPEALADGSEDNLIGCLDWASIACGGHAGDDESMREVARLCVAHGVRIGAHPGYPDRERFGRAALECTDDEVTAFVAAQVAALGRIAERLGAVLRHVKPHGALYNLAARDAAVAAAIARGVARWSREPVLVGLAGSQMLAVWQEEGFQVAAEAFADRRYGPSGELLPRSLPDALITDPREAARQAYQIAREGHATAAGGERVTIRADTICIHSDTPGALDIVRAVRAALRSDG
jgi:5-oxoprolinase (ATP-hydrolysing) subunit A